MNRVELGETTSLPARGQIREVSWLWKLGARGYDGRNHYWEHFLVASSARG